MVTKKEKLKKDIESGVLFALAKEAKPELLYEIEHWPEVGNFLVTRKLAGKFYHRLKLKSLLSLVPESIQENLRQFYHLTAIKNKVFFQQLSQIQERLEARGANLVLLKGTSLILRGVFHPGERYQSDLDFLVSGISREELREEISKLGYLPVHHSDAQEWSEENFILAGSKLGGDVFSVFLEFHWTFRPINHQSGEQLAQGILANPERVKYNSRFYQIPSPEFQFYQASLHGSADHRFDSGYFWVGLMDLSAIWEKLILKHQAILNFAQEQGLVEHLGVMGFLVWNKLGLGQEFWEELIKRVPNQKELIEQTAQRLWNVLLNLRPISLNQIIYLFAPTDIKNKRKALWELTGLRKKGDEVQINGVHLENARPNFFALLSSRLRSLDWDFLKLIWQMAKFYHRVKVYFPPGG